MTLPDGPSGPPESTDDAPLSHVLPAYRHVLRLRLALFWVIPVVAAIILDMAFDGSPWHGLASTAVPLLALIAVVVAPNRVYRRLRYRLTDTMLQVIRGWMVQTDTIVPLVRVQHIDVTRGPAEKLFGTATLVVHTAGTHNSIVTLPGLAPETAERIREEMRRHVRTDFE